MGLLCGDNTINITTNFYKPLKYIYIYLQDLVKESEKFTPILPVRRPDTVRTRQERRGRLKGSSKGEVHYC